MQLVILAAGHGRRFGGLKQLAPVGPGGEAIMDYTALAAQACGFSGIVLVVREEIRAEVAQHVRRRWPSGLPVEYVCQPPVPGTAAALLCSRPAVTGPFGVANADDLYGEAALRPIVELLASGTDSSPHVLVAYHLSQTVLTAATVTRGLCELGGRRLLRRVAEHRVTRRDDGRFDAVPLAQAAPPEGPRSDLARPLLLSGEELVSMNLFGFRPRLYEELDDALRRFDPETAERPELLLPDVVGSLVASGSDQVAVVTTENRCIGITHREDVTLVREEIARESAHLDALRAARG